MSLEDASLLVIEDDPDALLLLKRAFRKVGLEAPLHVVVDGDAAVAYLAGEGEFADRRAHPLPTVILLNLKLPKRSGLEVLEWISKRPEIHRIPVIIVTTSDEESDRKRAAELGARNYNVKPLDSNSLVRLALKIKKATEEKGEQTERGNGNG